MIRRWIIRSFFIGLLLLFVGGWVTSYQRQSVIHYWGPISLGIDCHWGKIYLSKWTADPSAYTNRWYCAFHSASAAADSEYIAQFHHHYLLGFGFEKAKKLWVAIPFWFLTIISSVLLWLVWRKTRPKPVGRAFPVDTKESQQPPRSQMPQMPTNCHK